MGVQGLLGLLKSIQKPCKLDSFRGQTIGVDAYGWLHRGAIAGAVELATGKPTKKHINFALHRVRMLIHFGITPYIVFDGDRLPSKNSTEQGRADRRATSKAKGLELLRQGKEAAAFQEFQKCIDITPRMARELIEELKKLGVLYVVAPYEADAQLVFLEREGLIDGILSEDSDMLVFGAKVLLTKLDHHGDCVMIRRADFTACKEVNLTGMQDADFRCMAILSGCDYLESLPKMGLKTAHKATRRFKGIERILRGIQLENKIRVPIGYLERFIQADNTFKYQYVFCPRKRKLVYLTEPGDPTQFEGMGYIGAFVENNVACGVADGYLDPMTKASIEMPRVCSKTNVDVGNKTPLTLQRDLGKHKSIETFFKPKRTPLAELDPNSFTPSPVQRQTLERNRSRQSWPSETVQTSFEADINSPFTMSASDQTSYAANAARGSKRLRLCAEEQDACISTNGLLPTSKYFGNSLQSTPPSASRKRAGKKANRSTFNLWSDDSIEVALANLPDPAASQVPGAEVGSPKDGCRKKPATSDQTSEVKLPTELHTSLTGEMEALKALTETRAGLFRQPAIGVSASGKKRERSPPLSHAKSVEQDNTRNSAQSTAALGLSASTTTVTGASRRGQAVKVGGSEDLLVAESDSSGTEEVDESVLDGGVGLVESSPAKPAHLSGFAGLGHGLDLSRFLFEASPALKR